MKSRLSTTHQGDSGLWHHVLQQSPPQAVLGLRPDWRPGYHKQEGSSSLVRMGNPLSPPSWHSNHHWTTSPGEPPNTALKQFYLEQHCLGSPPPPQFPKRKQFLCTPPPQLPCRNNLPVLFLPHSFFPSFCFLPGLALPER